MTPTKTRDELAYEYTGTRFDVESDLGAIECYQGFQAGWDACEKHRDELFNNKDPYYKIRESEYDALIEERDSLKREVAALSALLSGEIVTMECKNPSYSATVVLSEDPKEREGK